MLERLSVADFALIEEATIELDGGFVAFTGETGAGKSLVVGSIGFLLGGRADSGMIREGAEACEVSGVLNVSDNESALTWLAGKNISPEEGRILLRRGLKRTGRSFALIQGRQVTRNELQEFSALVADIHGQHDHQTLLDPASHLEFLDEFAGSESLRETYSERYAHWIGLARAYKAKSAQAASRMAEMDFLQHRMEEIRAAHLRAGEEEDLLKREKLLASGERLEQALDLGIEAFETETGDGNLLARLKKASLELGALKDADATFEGLARRLESAAIELEDIRSELVSSREKLQYAPGNLEEVESRLAEIRRLKRKYGPEVQDVLSRLEEDARALDSLKTWEDDSASLRQEISAARDEALEASKALSRHRKEAAARLQGAVERILPRLGMDGATFPLSIEPSVSEAGKLVLGPAGQDKVEFLIAPNRGEPAQPLAKIASGGELSRIALAIKAALSQKHKGDLLIFDEVDAGIGGEVALAVGEYLREISASAQVLCVTHLASIAARAGTQLLVEKREERGRTVTTLRELKGEEREMEIARMLAGDRRGEIPRSYAAELLSRT